jgi:hypothetical protein
VTYTKTIPTPSPCFLSIFSFAATFTLENTTKSHCVELLFLLLHRKKIGSSYILQCLINYIFQSSVYYPLILSTFSCGMCARTFAKGLIYLTHLPCHTIFLLNYHYVKYNSEKCYLVRIFHGNLSFKLSLCV